MELGDGLSYAIPSKHSHMISTIDGEFVRKKDTTVIIVTVYKKIAVN